MCHDASEQVMTSLIRLHARSSLCIELARAKRYLLRTRRQKFFRIEYPFGIEHLLDIAHEVEHGRRALARDERALLHAHAVFARERALEYEHQREDAVEAVLGTRHLDRVVRVHEQIDVYIAVAGVAEVDDGDSELARELLESTDEFGHARHGHHHDYVDLLGGDGAERRRQGLARGPQRTDFFLRARDREFHLALVLCRARDAVGGGADRGVLAVDLYLQHRARRLRQGDLRIIADHLDRARGTR